MKRLALLLALFAFSECEAARPLKQSTAITVIVGPFVDKTDGITPETALTVTSITADLFKDNATEVSLTITASGGSNDCVHVANGQYSLELTTTDTNTLGYLRLTMTYTAEAVPIWEDFVILPANVYDSLYSTDKLQVHVTEYTAGVIDDAAIAPDAIGASEIAANAITSSEAPNLDAAVSSRSSHSALAVWQVDMPSNFDPSGTSAGAVLDKLTEESVTLPTQVNINSVFGYMMDNGTLWTYNRSSDSLEKLGEDIPAILVDTSTTLDNYVDEIETRLTAIRAGYLDNLNGHIPQTGDSFVRIGATGSGLTSLASQASVTTIDDFLDTEIAEILADTNELQLNQGNWVTATGFATSADITTALEALGLDHLIAVAVNKTTDIVDNSIIAILLSKGTTADADTYNNRTDSLEAISDKQ